MRSSSGWAGGFLVTLWGINPTPYDGYLLAGLFAFALVRPLLEGQPASPQDDSAEVQQRQSTPASVSPALVKAAPRYFSLIAFGVSQVVIDCETAYNIFHGRWPLRRDLHTLPGASVPGRYRFPGRWCSPRDLIAVERLGTPLSGPAIVHGLGLRGAQ